MPLRDWLGRERQIGRGVERSVDNIRGISQNILPTFSLHVH
jgi:hypothetical protein